MKNFIAVMFIIFCVCFSALFAQSDSSNKKNDVKKANKRPVETTKKEETKTDETIPEDSIYDETEEVVSIEVVTIPVKVMSKGRFVAGLQKEKFRVFDNNTEQPIEFFTNEQQPFTVALVLDMSYSASFKINEIQQAAIDFIGQLRKDDQVLIVSFDQDVRILSEPTSDRAQLQKAIMQTRINYGTSLYEAVDVVVNRRLKKINGRKAIVLFTDGVDTSSERVQALSNLRDVTETDALVYPIKYDTYADVQKMKGQAIVVPPTVSLPSSTPNPLPFPIPAGGIGTADGRGTRIEDYEKANEYLNQMADRTGGKIYEADSVTNLNRAFAAIASELREYYSIGYYLPDVAEPGEKRSVKIQVDAEKVSVKARDSYTVGKNVKK